MLMHAASQCVGGRMSMSFRREEPGRRCRTSALASANATPAGIPNAAIAGLPRGSRSALTHCVDSRESDMWLVWCLSGLIAISLLLSMVDKPPSGR